MLSSIRKHFTFANVAMTLALVFAMSGGAYAAKKYLITSTKQISPKALKQLQGKAGARGLAGAAGPAGERGPAGEKGANGINGTNGKDGVSVTATKLSPGNKECPDGGSEFKSASGTAYACNGQTGFTETLPSGKTETGEWAIGPGGEGFGAIFTGASFNIPLATAAIPVYVKRGESTPEHCTGSVSEPGAEPGFLCVFAEEEFAIAPSTLVGPGRPAVCSAVTELNVCISSTAHEGTDRYGFVLLAIAEPKGYATGSWAVTAE